MGLVNPFGWWSSAAQKRAFIVLFVLGLIIMYAWSALDAPLKNEAAPRGILSFEVAGTLSEAKSILASWGHPGELRAAANLGLDYLFLAVYGGTIALGCVLVTGALLRWRWFAAAGLILAWSQLAAALLDSVENYALIRILLGAQESWLPVLAWWCAIPKSILYAAGMLYIASGAILFLGWKILRLRPS